MTIWILAVVLMAISVSAGYVQGAIRSIVSLVGIIAGIFLAIPLSPMVKALLPFVGITGAFPQAFVGPIVAFFLVGAAFKVGGNFLHRKIEYFYKYRASDGERALWQRMNQRVGAAIGSIGGVIYLLLTCTVISVLGYLTTQIGASESNSGMVTFFNRMAEDTISTRMDRATSALNPAPASYFETCDFAGFLAQNRDVFKRVVTYPPIMAQGRALQFDNDRSSGNPNAVQALVDDTDFWKVLGSEADPLIILNHPRTQEILTNAEVRAWIEGLDLKDLTTYLTTGKSPKYGDEKLLGTWIYDWPASLMAAKRENREILASELIRYRREMEFRFESANLVATLDNRMAIKLPARLENTALPGLTNAPHRVSYSGQWRRSGDAYDFSLNARGGGKAETSKATVETQRSRRSDRTERTVDRLSFKIDNKPVCFVRIPD